MDATPMLPVSPLYSLLILSITTQRYAPVTKKIFDAEYDYIIVGAGSAGSVVASRLSELSCLKVLLLEAGPSPPLETELPSYSESYQSNNKSWVWSFTTSPQKHTASIFQNNQVPFIAGKTLGGSSTVNGMFVSRGNPINYDEWADMGAKGWSYKEVLRYFMKLEHNNDIEYVRNGYHGVGGPMTISKPNYDSQIKDPLKRAASELGIEFVDIMGATQKGFYDHQSTTRDGQRCSTAKAYLVPGEYRPNLDIITEAFVTKVVFDGGNAKGVEFDFEGASHYVSASKEVILSAGAIGSAKLLMLSGIGPREQLESLKIPVIADLPVGLNLQDQCGNYVAFEMDPSIPPFSSRVASEQNIQEYISLRRGPLTSTFGATFMAFLSNSNSSNPDPLPDYQIYFEEDFMKFFNQRGVLNDVYDQVFKPHENKTVLVCFSAILHPKSRGSVSLQSSDPYDPPTIDPNYYEHPDDVTDVVEGLKACRKVMSTEAMSEFVVKELQLNYPGCEKLEDEQSFLECITRSAVFISSHLSGTAKMGDSSDPTTVVDPQLRVKTVSGLRVIDASVMPKVVWGNTNIPTIMIGEKASDIIKETISCK